MNKFLTLAAALSAVALLSHSAGAADLRGTLPPIEPLPPAFTWTGFHIGAQGGYADVTDNGLLRNVVSTESYTFHRNAGDAMGGGQIGYDAQIGVSPVVIGLEGDVMVGDIIARGPTTLSRSQTQIFSTNADEIDVLATVRGRLGYAFDRTLIYATGGLAIRDGESTHTQYYTSTFGTPFTSKPFATDRDHDTSLGYVVGAGVEYAFANHWSAKAEYNYMRFDDMTADYPHALATVNDTPVVNARRTYSTETVNLAKAGINYRF